jgi:uncharacterized protein YutE (UPF0331/DUF86 family)
MAPLDIAEYEERLEQIFSRHNVRLAYLFGSQAEDKAHMLLDRLHKLEEYIHLLEPYQDWDIQRLTEDEITYGGVLHYLQLSAQIVLDVSAHLNAELGFERASDYREAILSLGKHEVLPRQFAERISNLSGFRNVIVHELATLQNFCPALTTAGAGLLTVPPSSEQKIFSSGSVRDRPEQRCVG